MAGSPLKRARKQGVRLADGSVIAFPYMPRVADLPAGWRHFSATQKVEHLIGLDRCYEILSWPWAGLDPVRRSMQMQGMRILLPIGIKAALDGSLDRDLARERDRQRLLEELSRKLREPLELEQTAGANGATTANNVTCTGKTGARVEVPRNRGEIVSNSETRAYARATGTIVRE